jgi:phosphoribosylanthranilate isomerase
MKLKVCGMTNFQQLKGLNELKVDFAGLIFYEGSKRFVGNKLKEQESAIRDLQIKKIGVFVNATIEDIKNAVEEYGLSYVQLHGDESPEFCEEIKEFVPVIKAIRISDEINLENELKKFDNACDYFLFDTHISFTGEGRGEAYGGTGKKFNWEILQTASISKPFFLSGGIGLQDVEEISAFQHSMLYAIDVNSKFEISPGVKDLELVEAFIQHLNE